jgi:hypothetical protein
LPELPRHWPGDKIPGAQNLRLSEAEAARLAALQRRPFALNKRERDELTKLLRKAGP